jgi:sialate O-acetylesterase
MAHARFQSTQEGNRWRPDHTIIHVWSPLVKQPVAVRYAWATSPMGNLKVNGLPSQPFPSFRTDTWEWPESDDPDESLVRPKEKAIVKEAADRCEFRRTEEAKAAVQILERIRTLGQVKK